MCDYFGGRIVTGTVNAAGTAVENIDTLVLCPNYDPSSDACGPDDYQGWPVNLEISPDGQTAIVNDAFWGMVHVLRITGTGTAAPGTPFQLWGLGSTYADFLADPSASGPDGNQSTRFNGNGEAIIVQNGFFSQDPDPLPLNDRLTRLRHDGPGQVSLDDLFFVTLESSTSGQLFGVDVLALTQDGRALTGDPSAGGEVPNGTLVNLASGAASVVPLNANLVPTGVAVLPQAFTAVSVPTLTPVGLGALTLLLVAVARRRRHCG
jgi:hypothetical protein